MVIPLYHKISESLPFSLQFRRFWYLDFLRASLRRNARNAALDIRLRRCYAVEKAASDTPLPPSTYFALCFTLCDVYTKTGIDHYPLGRKMVILSLLFSYCADIVPFICSMSVLAIAKPRPVDFLAASTV